MLRAFFSNCRNKSLIVSKKYLHELQEKIQILKFQKGIILLPIDCLVWERFQLACVNLCRINNADNRYWYGKKRKLPQ